MNTAQFQQWLAQLASLTTLLYEMQRRDVKKGLVTLCVGGGQGIALTVER